MVFLDFEKPIAELYEQLENLRQVGTKGQVDVSKTLTELEAKITEKKKEIYSNLNGWQKVQISRHPERPYTLFYISQIAEKFIEQHGDRLFGDDKAIVGGFASFAGDTVMFIGHQKGINLKMRQYR